MCSSSSSTHTFSCRRGQRGSCRRRRFGRGPIETCGLRRGAGPGLGWPGWLRRPAAARAWATHRPGPAEIHQGVLVVRTLCTARPAASSQPASCLLRSAAAAAENMWALMKISTELRHCVVGSSRAVPSTYKVHYYIMHLLGSCKVGMVTKWYLHYLDSYNNANSFAWSPSAF